VFALGILVTGIVGMISGEISTFEAGRLYLVALGLYLIAPAELLPKPERGVRLLLSRPRYMLGALSVTLAIVIMVLQSVAQAL
jgi:hypothetical protein